ncbi:MAG TPA: PhoH family protein [Candidatus Dormibacteraeota bacterium]|nr:PhoH family protein [Candidatus Dormibacteraeota bacterium]
MRLFGAFDANLVAIEQRCSVRCYVDGERLILAGAPQRTAHAEQAVQALLTAALRGEQMTPEDVALAVADAGVIDAPPTALPATLMRSKRGREIRARTAGQRSFVEAIERHALTIAIGPAGTGKTFLAIAMALRALRERNVSRIVLTRPAVEAGERLGFLPGDLKEKIDPYLRPLYDAIDELLDDSTAAKYLERGTIEVAPLAYMRGRTLADAFVIADEAQNASPEQMKMLLTRIGVGSTMVVVGDATQIDLPSGARSGLRDAARRLRGVEEVAVIDLDERDVIRRPLVARIVRAYDAQ